jgi:hypothetical protein
MAQSTGTASIVERPWSADVAVFAAAQGVEEALPLLLEATRRIFPSAQRLEVHLEDDPEIANERYIVYKVELTGIDVPQAVEAHSRWHGHLLNCCPRSQACLFQLDMELVE